MAIRAVAFILKRHTACEIAEAAAKHFTNTISTSLTEQIMTTISPQIAQIQSLTETLKTTIHDTETLHKNMQCERDEKEGDSQTAAERIEEATNILHNSVNECKDTLKTLQPVLETTQKHVTHLSTQLHASKQLNANHTQTPGPTKPTYSSVTAADLPPSIDQAMARAAARARQILITPKTGNNIFPDTNQHADIVKMIKQALTKASNDETLEGGVKSVQTLHSEAIIIKLDTEELATWLRSPAGQGDPLSMILYIIYNSDLVDIVKKRQGCAALKELTLAFVDDTAFIAIGKNFTETHDILKDMLERPNGGFKWSRSHNSHFETTKFALIDFSMNRNKECPPP
ncbi:hypothetical protein BDR06DRAFT_1008306 [Suillus hirtellus]|nr:hypothetical protein BDR06DRAFT_1008306 [Suillus hirtellus]